MLERLSETRLLYRVGGLLLAGALVAWLLGGSPDVFWTATVGVVIVAVQLHLALRSRKARQVERAQIQAMMDLHALIDVRAPLPPMTGWSATPELVRELLGALLDERPQLIVEAGSGVSTLVNGYGLEKLGSGRLVSLDHDHEFAEVTRRNVARHGLAAIVEVRDAPLVEHTLEDGVWHWYDVSGLPEDMAIDLLVVDGPPQHVQRLARYPALPVMASRLRDGALVILDDAARPDERAIAERWRTEFPGLEHIHVPSQKGIAIFRYRRAQ